MKIKPVRKSLGLRTKLGMRGTLPDRPIVMACR
jgi:hypothetical protein